MRNLICPERRCCLPHRPEGADFESGGALPSAKLGGRPNLAPHFGSGRFAEGHF
jgi:hypothetical protein